MQRHRLLGYWEIPCGLSTSVYEMRSCRPINKSFCDHSSTVKIWCKQFILHCHRLCSKQTLNWTKKLSVKWYTTSHLRLSSWRINRLLTPLFLWTQQFMVKFEIWHLYMHVFETIHQDKNHTQQAILGKWASIVQSLKRWSIRSVHIREATF
jgi:hypothetical protein